MRETYGEHEETVRKTCVKHAQHDEMKKVWVTYVTCVERMLG